MKLTLSNIKQLSDFNYKNEKKELNLFLQLLLSREKLWQFLKIVVTENKKILKSLKNSVIKN